MLVPVRIEGFEGRRVEVETSGVFSGAKLLVDGAPAPSGPKRGQMTLVRSDGTEVVAAWKGRFLDVPQLVVDGRSIDVVEPLKPYEWAWVGWPLVLVFVGGALGGLAGAIAVAVNTTVFRGPGSPLFRYGVTAAVSVLAVVAWLLAVTWLTVMFG